ncbi:unnamed protein product [Camellia sinensis]
MSLPERPENGTRFLSVLFLLPYLSFSFPTVSLLSQLLKISRAVIKLRCKTHLIQSCDSTRLQNPSVIRSCDSRIQNSFALWLIAFRIGAAIQFLKTQSNKAHCNYFKFTDDDDDDVTSTIRSNTRPRKAITIEELYELRAILSEMENEIYDHGRRHQKMEKKWKAMIYVIVFYMILYLIM